jgi:hypothetical protein
MATVVSTAEFQVKILGLTAYRYRHRAVEQWRDGCLLELSARTDDNGRSSQVESRPQGPGCVMSYAYWDARLLGQQRLLNPQTGAYDRIQVQHLGSQVLKVRDTPLRAEHYALSSEQLKIELWYSPAGEWLQLDSTTEDGKRLRYRLN